MLDRSDRAHVAWDIETTGFGWSEEITVSGVWFPGGHATLVVNSGSHAADGDRLAESLEETSGATVRVRIADDETELLEEMRRVVFERFDRDYNRLVAYNADSWKGGFDLPFTRTRCIHFGVEWVFDGIEFADLWQPVKKRLNTTHTGYGASDDANSLTGAHAILCEKTGDPEQLLEDIDGHPWYGERRYDPFEDSGSAAARYRECDLLSVCQHNLCGYPQNVGAGRIRPPIRPHDGHHRL